MTCNIFWYRWSNNIGDKAINMVINRTLTKYNFKEDVLVIGGGTLIAEPSLMELKHGNFKNVKNVVGISLGVGPLFYFNHDYIPAELYEYDYSDSYQKNLLGLVESMEFVSVRDEMSKRILENIGIEREITLAADAAFNLNIKRTKNLIDKFEFLDEDFVMVSLRGFFNQCYRINPVIYDKYLTALASFLNMIPEKKVFVSLDNDIPIMFNLIHKGCTIDYFITMDDPEELIYVMEKSRMVIGERLHSLIFSARAGTPYIALENHLKISGLNEEINFMNHPQITNIYKSNITNPEYFNNLYKYVNNNYNEIKKYIKKRVALLRKREKRNYEWVKNYV